MSPSAKLQIFIATLGPVGKLPYWPGSWGSFFSVIFWWFLIPAESIFFKILIPFLIFLPAVWLSTRAEKELGRDARPIVIDELVGQWIALIPCSKNIWQATAAFFLFRLFDIWKPFPINSSQNLPAGWGVVIDDVIAGIYTVICMLILLRTFDWLN